MDARTLAERIAEYVFENDHVSFAELSRKWPDHFDVPGAAYEYVISGDGPGGRGGFDNIVLWAGMSEVGVEAINLVRKDERVELKPAHQLVYLIDGGALRLPIATGMRRYKEPHWLPCTIAKKAMRSKRQGRIT